MNLCIIFNSLIFLRIFLFFEMDKLLPLLDIESEFVLDIYDIYELVEFIQSLEFITKEKIEEFIGDISTRGNKSSSVFSEWTSYHDEKLVKCMYLLSKCTFEILEKIFSGEKYKNIVAGDLVTVLAGNPIGFFICFSDSNEESGKKIIYNALNSARLFILRNVTEGDSIRKHLDDFISKFLIEKGMKTNL